MVNFGKLKNRMGYLLDTYYTDVMLAKDLNKSHRTITNWKQGKTSPTVEDLQDMADLSGFDVADLLEAPKHNDEEKLKKIIDKFNKL